MPIYEYQCVACGHEMEKLQKMSDPALTDCPECKQAELKKKISAAGFRLKGTGWYETDFKNSGKKPANDKAKKETKESNKASSSKDSKQSTKASSASD